jgi:hypothetical protein
MALRLERETTGAKGSGTKGSIGAKSSKDFWDQQRDYPELIHKIVTNVPLDVARASFPHVRKTRTFDVYYTYAKKTIETGVLPHRQRIPRKLALLARAEYERRRGKLEQGERGGSHLGN